MLFRYGIEIVARRVAALLQLRIVIATPHHHGARRQSPLGDEAAQHLLHIGDVAHAADRRRGEVGETLRSRGCRDMAVCINEAWQQNTGTQIDDAGAGHPMAQHLDPRAHCDDSLTGHRHRLGP